VINNTSNRPQKIKVIKTSMSEFPLKDSLKSDDIDSTKRSNPEKRKVFIDKNDSEKSFSFELGTGKSVIIEEGLCCPDTGQNIIINEIDTIKFSSSKRVKTERKLSYTRITIMTQ
jgi:hypothetical protein